MEIFVYNKFIKISFFLSLVLIAFACNDDPTSVGDALIPNGDRITFQKIDSYSNNLTQTFSTFQKDSLFYGTSQRVLLGSYKNLSIDMLIDFGILFPDSIKDGLNNKEITLKSSWIEMKPNYWLGDKSHFEFSVKEINQSWTSNDFNNDTLNAVKSSLGNEILVQDSYSFSDSLIKFSIDEQVVNKWVLHVASNSLVSNNGLYFSPISNTGIVGFQAIARFIKSDYISLNMIFEKQGVILDTIKAVQSLDLHVVTSTEPEKNENSLVLQSSSSVRGKLWFDVSSVPANAILNKATLNLYIDELNTEIGSIKTDTVAISFFENRTENIIKKEYGIAALLKKDNSYSGDIRRFVQRWVNGENNEGMQVRLSDEERSANKIAFYKSNYQVDSLRPRLTIFYTTAKEK
jgi:hypothetical protein